MQYRKLGRNGPNVSALGLGCMSIGIADTYTSSVRGDDDAIALIHHALDVRAPLRHSGKSRGCNYEAQARPCEGRSARS
jgi:hypothetical protein